jgi:hypothetical protein
MILSASTKFLLFRQMAYVAGVNHERRLYRQSTDFADRLLERADRIRIGRLVETDMAVADLKESERGGRCHRLAGKPERFRDAAFDRPEDAGSSPDCIP